jgi:SAM-dependent methyltransferase
VNLERAIAQRFEDIADIGWFPDRLPPDAPQLQAVREILQPRRGQKILDAGCARGRFAHHIPKTGGARSARALRTNKYIYARVRVRLPSPHGTSSTTTA